MSPYRCLARYPATVVAYNSLCENPQPAGKGVGHGKKHRPMEIAVFNSIL